MPSKTFKFRFADIPAKAKASCTAVAPWNWDKRRSSPWRDLGVIKPCVYRVFVPGVSPALIVVFKAQIHQVSRPDPSVWRPSLLFLNGKKTGNPAKPYPVSKTPYAGRRWFFVNPACLTYKWTAFAPKRKRRARRIPNIRAMTSIAMAMRPLGLP